MVVKRYAALLSKVCAFHNAKLFDDSLGAKARQLRRP